MNPIIGWLAQTQSNFIEGREGEYQTPVPRLIFAKIPVTKSKIPLLMIICKIMRIIN